MASSGREQDAGSADDGQADATPSLAERAYRWFGGSRALILAALVGAIISICGLVWNVRVAGDCGGLHLSLQFAGTDERLQWLLSDCAGSTPTRGIFVADFVFIFGYWLLCTAILVGGWWRYEAAALRRASWIVLLLPTFVAAMDLLENLSLLVLMEDDSGQKPHLQDGFGWLNWLQLTASWTKWMGAFVMVIGVAMAAAVWASRRHEPLPAVEGPHGSTPDAADAYLGKALGRGLRPATPAPAGRTASRHDIDWPHPDDDPEQQALDAEVASANKLSRPSAFIAAKTTGTEPDSVGQDTHPADKPPPGAGPRVGICLSGGGIRSAAFCLGALSELEKPMAGAGAGTPPTESARYLAAVSGGGWAATAWTLQKALQPGLPAADTVIKGLKDTAEPAGYPRQNYLMNGRGGIIGVLSWVLICAMTNLVLVGSLIYLIAWPLALFLGQRPIDSGQLPCDPRCEPEYMVPHHLYVPSIVFALLGAAWLAFCGCTDRRWARKWPIGVGLLGASLFSVAYLIWIPHLFHAIHGDIGLEAAIGAISGSVIASVAGPLWKVVGGPLVREAQGRLWRALPRLLGVLLGLGAAAWMLLVMYYASASSWKWWTVILAAAVVLGMYIFLGPNWPTLHNIFSKRLRRSFDAVAEPFTDPQALEAAAEGTWKWLEKRTRSGDIIGSPTEAGTVPELILCCAQQRNGIAAGGLRAEAFTVSPRFVRQGGRTMATDKYLHAARVVKRLPWWWEYGELHRVSAWLATTGAAFSSAMGRMSLGSTNAFLAAVNADLGIWLPNLVLLQNEQKRRNGKPRDHKALLPRPRFAYILKEILGWYSLDDRFVFVTDGGHWDNLGLVELLRKHCDVIYGIDASGDPAGSFATLRQSLELASLELKHVEGVSDVDDALVNMLPKTGSPPANIATTIRIKRIGRPDAIVYYTKLQATRDMNHKLKRWASANPKFPGYSTVHQFLSRLQFGNLVELGRHAGAALRLAESRENSIHDDA